MTHRRATAVIDKHNRRYRREITIFSIARYSSASISICILSNQVYAAVSTILLRGNGGGFVTVFKQVVAGCTLSTSKQLALFPATRCFSTFAQSRNARINFMSVINTILTHSRFSGLACGRCRAKYTPEIDLPPSHI